ncbi:hypothetical protein J3R30DRAFT_3698434 [Lentinula aciculospora]|uniref:Uncharacterized protein n=1 Tax=Lentinula aciculospora TaxID=153920 RepID=A0A9W9DSJ5_9AGAR|nr:hypothetical protein J3R30DRAFT_3698434 [Lentinula aciculospora]
MTTPSSSVPRLVVVDDTDPTIQYSPPSAFSLDSTGSLDQLGNGGPAFNKTLTGTTTNASLSYTFNGTFVRAMVAAVGTTYSWNCTVDNHLITSFTVDTNQVTNYIACDSAGVLQGTTGEHTLDVNLSFRPTNTSNSTQSLWLDSIQYQPLPSNPLDSVTLRVHNSDPSVTYSNSSGGWSWQGFESNSTQRTGTSMNFAFNGSSVTLYSVNFGSPTLFNATTAFYAVDGNSGVNFDLPGSAKAQNTGNYSNIINYPLFIAPDLSTSPHNIEVATSYNSSSTPQYLTIDYFMVKTNPANSTSPEQASNSSSTDSGTSSAATHSDVAAIVGGVIGGLVGLAGLLLLLYHFRRRKRDRYSGMMLDLSGGGAGYYRSNVLEGDTLEVTPFISSAEHPGTSIPMKYTAQDSTAYTGQPSNYSPGADGSSSSDHHPTRSSGWNPNRFVTSKNTRILQVEDEQIRRGQIRQHEDSGVRIPSGSGEEIVDVPPTYTES